MPLSSESYQRIAKDSGYRVDSLEKVIRLGEMLKEIDTDQYLQPALALRGGTALNLEVDAPPRLSVDLDFDYIGEIERDGMLQEKPKVIAQIQVIGRSLGYQVTNKSDAPAGTSIQLGYQNATGTQDLLKIDISWTNRVGIEPKRRVNLWQPEGLEPVEFTLVGSADLIAGKFRALIDRTAARDVFDVVQISKRYGESWPPAEIKSAFIFVTGTLSLPLTSYGVDRLDRLTQEDFVNNLLPMLNPDLELTRDQLVEDAKIALSKLLQFEDNEREFISSLDKGHLRPELLFNQVDAARLAKHPHLLWKTQNRAQHLKDTK